MAAKCCHFQRFATVCNIFGQVFPRKERAKNMSTSRRLRSSQSGAPLGGVTALPDRQKHPQYAVHVLELPEHRVHLGRELTNGVM